MSVISLDFSANKCAGFFLLCALGWGTPGPAAETPPAAEKQAAIAALTALPTLAKKVDFEKEVLPIFKRNCLACHNATDAEADLVLETPVTIMKGGENGPVVVPHKSVESLLLGSSARVSKPKMPPKDNKVGAEILKADELAILKAWIDQGATGTVSVRQKAIVWKPLPPGLHPILAVAVTADGQFAACGRANQIFIYHVPTGQIVARLTDPKLAEGSGRSGFKGSAQRDFVQSLAFSPDGRVLASGEYRMVKLWQKEPNLPQFTLGAQPVTALAISPKGRWIATAGDDRLIRLWDMATGQAGKEMPGHTDTVRALAISPDGTKLASVAGDKTLRVWDLASGKQVTQAEIPQPAETVAWTLGGRQLATAGGDNSIRLWTLPAAPDAPLVAAKELPGHTKPVTCLEPYLDGKRFLSGSLDGAVRQWDAEGAKQLKVLDQGAPVADLAIAPSGKTFAAATGNQIRLWNLEAGKPIADLKGDPRLRAALAGAEAAVAFAKNEGALSKTDLDAATKAQSAKADALKKAGEAVAVATKAAAEKKEAVAKVTDEKAKPAAEDAAKKAETARTTAITAQKGSEAAAQVAEKLLASAKAAVEKAAAALPKAEAAAAKAKTELAESEQKGVRAIAFAPDGLTIATAGDDQVIHTWSAETGVGFDTFPSQLGPVGTLAYTPDGRIVSSAAQKGAIVWRTGPRWTLARTLGTGDEKSPLSNRVLALSFSHDGRRLATGGGVPSRSGEVKIWNVADASLNKEITPSHSDTVFALDFSPDDQLLATAGADKFVKVFEATSGKLVKSLSGHTHYALGVAWRADGRVLASSGADKVVKLWSWPSGDQIKTVEGFTKEVTSVRFVGLGTEVLTASGDTKVRLIKEDGGTARDFGGNKGFIFSTAVTPDGQVILGGGQDSMLRIWSGATGKALFSLEAPSAEK